MSDFNLGTVTAYGYAKDKGYTGTEDEYAELMASYADVAEQAAESATQAAASATTATAKASEAAQSATAAASSKTAAQTAQTGAETAAQTATTKAGEASTSATTASNKATEATTAATTATGKATEAAGSATTAATKAGEASTSATNAAASATRAQEILDSIPADYSQLSEAVEDLKDGLSDIHPSAANSTENTNNLLVMNPKYFGNVINGLTLNKSNDGTIYVNGTASANVDIPVTGEYVTDKALSFPAGTYTFALINMSGFSNTNRCYVRYAYDLTSAATNIVWQSNNARTATVTFTQDAYVFIQLYSGATYSNAYFQLQIEKGTNASPVFSMPSMMADYKARFDIEKLAGSTNESKKINNDSYKVGLDFPKSFVVTDLLEDMSTSTASSGTSKYVYTHRFQRHNSGYLLTNNGSSDNMYLDFYVNTPLAFYGVQEFDIAIYIPSNASNISKLRFRCISSGYDAYRNQTFVNGWNFIRIGMNGVGQGASVTENRIRLHIYYADSSIVTPVYLCAVQAVKPPHASVVFVEDAGYASFYDSAYPLLKTIGCPVTWALECANIQESREGTRSLISLSELTTLENDGISDFSWHGYSGEKTIELDAEETAEYNLKCLRFLAKRGDITGKIFRAVWPGNTAPNYEIAINDLDAAATYDATADLVIYPYPNKYNIPRISLQSRDTTWIDSMISQLQNTHQTVYIYTHGIIDSSSFDPQGQDMRLDMLQYLITKLQGGISDGWLKCTTYNRLEREYWS